MHRRITVALAATAVAGLAAAGAAGPAAAAQKKKTTNQLRIVGGVVVKPGKFVKDDQRFAPRVARIKSGTTVTLRNRAKTQDPHTISFVQERFLPEEFETDAMGPLLAAHQVDPNNQEAPPAVLVVDNGQPLAQGATLNVDTMGDDKVAGDSAFIAPGQKTFTFKLTARKGSELYYFCAVHPWMQGEIRVR
jgi:plastocyanin